MTKFAYMSDLHLDKAGATKQLMMKTMPDADCLIIAGDVTEYMFRTSSCEFLSTVNEKYNRVIWVPGNHEYWTTDFNEAKSRYEQFIKEEGWSNIEFIERGVTMVNDVKLICASLWTDFDNQNIFALMDWGAVMNDSTEILCDGKRLNASDVYERHISDLEFIESELSNTAGKSIVITHHAPSVLSVSNEYKASRWNSYYYSDLFDLVHGHNFKAPEVWVHGHLHNSSDYMLGETRVVCNPVGYKQHHESKNFEYKVIEL